MAKMHCFRCDGCDVIKVIQIRLSIVSIPMNRIKFYGISSLFASYSIYYRLSLLLEIITYTYYNIYFFIICHVYLLHFHDA